MRIPLSIATSENKNSTKMAIDVLIVFWLITFFVTLIVHDSATQITMLDNVRSIEQCDVMCATAFADSKASCVACIICIIIY